MCSRISNRDRDEYLAGMTRCHSLSQPVAVARFFHESGPYFIAMRPHEKPNDLACTLRMNTLAAAAVAVVVATATSYSNIQSWIMRIMEIQPIIKLRVLNTKLRRTIDLGVCLGSSNFRRIAMFLTDAQLNLIWFKLFE